MFLESKETFVQRPLDFRWKGIQSFGYVWKNQDDVFAWKKPVEYGREKYINIGNQNS